MIALGAYTIEWNEVTLASNPLGHFFVMTNCVSVSTIRRRTTESISDDDLDLLTKEI